MFTVSKPLSIFWMNFTFQKFEDSYRWQSLGRYWKSFNSKLWQNDLKTCSILGEISHCAAECSWTEFGKVKSSASSIGLSGPASYPTNYSLFYLCYLLKVSIQSYAMKILIQTQKYIPSNNVSIARVRPAFIYFLCLIANIQSIFSASASFIWMNV